MAKSKEKIEMACLVSDYEHGMFISRLKKQFPNDEDIALDFKPGVPVGPIPKKIAEHYAETYPKKYKVVAAGKAKAAPVIGGGATAEPEVDEEEPISVEENENAGEEDAGAEEQDDFDAVEFLNAAQPVSIDELQILTDAQLWAVKEAAELKNCPKNIGRTKLIHRIKNKLNPDIEEKGEDNIPEE